MPVVGKGRPRGNRRTGAASRNTNRDENQQPDQDSHTRRRIPPDSEPPGRLRTYADPDDELAQFNLRSPETPEGRLGGIKPSDWDVPVGDEVHLLRTHSKYRAADFHIETTNSHDHSVPWNSSVAPDMANVIDAILRGRKFPFDNCRRRFTNIALYELIQVCNRLESVPDSDTAILEAMNDLNHYYRSVINYDLTLGQQCRTVHDLVDQGLKNTARIMVHDMLRTIGRIKTRELREKHEKRVRAEFARLIREAKPVSGRPVRTSRQRR